MRAAAIIPSKGISTRLPRKNLIDFFGRPLIEHTISAAIDAGCFKRIFVSTEDEEIASVSRNIKGVVTVARPEKLAVDPASVMDVCNHVLDNVDEEFDYIFIMLPSTPLRSYQDVRAVHEIIEQSGPNAVMSVTEYPLSPIYAYTHNEKGCLVKAFAEMAEINSHTAQRYYADNGGIYALRQRFVREKEYCPAGTIPYVMPQWSSVDIDTAEDLEIAKAMYNHYIKESM